MFPSVKVDLSQFAGINTWAKDMAAEQVPFAAALALTMIGQDVKREIEQEMTRVFDRPTPYTMRGWRLDPARKNRLWSSVDFRSSWGIGVDGRNYLAPNTFGVKRTDKALELALRAAGHLPAGWLVVPGQGAKLDAFGNVSRGQIVQVLSQLRITMTAGYTRNMSFTARKAINAQRRAGGRFFVVKPGAGRLTPGVYQREFMGRNITPVFIFVNDANYKPRLQVEQIAQRVVRDRSEYHFERAMRRALASARQPQ